MQTFSTTTICEGVRTQTSKQQQAFRQSGTLAADIDGRTGRITGTSDATNGPVITVANGSCQKVNAGCHEVQQPGLNSRLSRLGSTDQCGGVHVTHMSFLSEGSQIG